MAMLLPVVVFALTYVVFAAQGRRPDGGGHREAMLSAATVVGAALALGTEILSQLRSVAFGPLVAFWLLLGLGVSWVVAMRRGAERGPTLRHGGWLGSLEGGWLGSLESVILLPALVLVGAVAIVAWASAPNTYDVVSYHLPRIVHWVQDRSIEIFPTHIVRQAFAPPFAEWVMLHTVILSKGDRWVQCVSCAAWLGGALAASELGRRVGLSARGQLFAGIFALSLPAACLQATSGKNDSVAVFWGVVAVTFFVDFWSSDFSLWHSVRAGAALGLGLATKATMPVFLLPALLVWGIAGIRSGSRVTSKIAVTLASALVLFGPVVLRNETVSGSPYGPADGGLTNTVNEAIGPGTLVSNAVRNAFLHLPPCPDSKREWIETAIRSGLDRLGIDPDDRATTFQDAGMMLARDDRGLHVVGVTFFLPALTFDESLAGNPWHAILLLVALPWLRLRCAGRLRILALEVLGGFALFCLLFKWQVWNTRLHTVLFVLAAPIAAKMLERSRLATAGVGCLLLLASFPYVAFQVHRPLVGSQSVLRIDRERQFFAFADISLERPALLVDLEACASAVRRLRAASVGVIETSNAPEYLLWVVLGSPFDGGPRIEHVGVSNATAAVGLREPAPDALLLFGAPAIRQLEWGGFRYRFEFFAGGIVVLARGEPVGRV